MWTLVFLLAAIGLVSGQASNSPSSTCLQAFQSSILSASNRYRSTHRSPPFATDSQIQAGAQTYSNYLASSGSFEHSGKPKLGENLWMASGYSFRNGVKTCSYVDSATSCSAAGAAAAKSWYDEVKNYNYNFPGFSSSTGHFTQLVWKSSTLHGCGLGMQPRTCTVVVTCNYSPQGNMNTQSQFRANVLKP